MIIKVSAENIDRLVEETAGDFDREYWDLVLRADEEMGYVRYYRFRRGDDGKIVDFQFHFVTVEEIKYSAFDLDAYWMDENNWPNTERTSPT